MSHHHKGEEMKGRLKEGVGAVTGDEGLKREGKVDQGSAHVKETVGNVADSVKNAVNPDRKTTTHSTTR